MIEKKIHYCWFGGKELPKDAKKCIQSWESKCPDYEIIKWDETNFDINCSEFVKEAYKNKAWAFVSDYARLKIIYENGGIYLDTDVEIIRNLDELLGNDCFLAQQQGGNTIATGLGFGAAKGNYIIKEMLDIYDKIAFDNDKRDDLACPILNTPVVKKYCQYSDNEISIISDNIKIYPPKYFDPLAPGQTKNLMCEETYSIHHYNASWTSFGNRLKRRIINLIGQKTINKLKGIF